MALRARVGETGANCRLCTQADDEERAHYRRTHGCDEPTERPQAALPCFSCNGAGCDKCEDGIVAIYRCPNSLVTRGMLFVVDAVLWAERGHLPAAGGMLDQCASFMAAYDIVTGELGALRQDYAAQQEARRNG